MSDPKEDGNQEELEWLLFELDEAREDQIVSLDHIVQFLVACIAALAILYSVAAGLIVVVTFCLCCGLPMCFTGRASLCRGCG